MVRSHGKLNFHHVWHDPRGIVGAHKGMTKRDWRKLLEMDFFEGQPQVKGVLKCSPR